VNVALLRLPLALAYPLLAHAASASDSGVLAAVALGDLLLVLLIGPLLRMRPWALALVLAAVPALAWLAHSPHAQLPLLAPPVLFTGLLCWLFARTLRRGRSPLITRVVELTEGPPTPDVARYTRRLTVAWALLMGLITVINATLALVAVPDGVLARLGHPLPLAVSQAGWSLFANLLNYGLVAGFFLAEYAYRRRRFPNRPYGNFAGFLRSLTGLGPDGWRELAR